eukprot:TRINITY_DN774156_c0_g1_i1.p2 TRINITY_DN774156_c0_g1~~TRINITY_DN774156_c0_g1_i1.p2  ORF type:complete len:196 (-),score=64.75 TRINITY_DN774156_c0_g1_i1:1192-1779(-)
MADEILATIQVDQSKLDDIEKELETEMAKLQLQFEMKRAPIYEERAKKIAKIPDFWEKCFVNGTIASNEIDCKIMAHLKVFNVVHNEDGTHQFEFTFEENEFFSNKTLVKKFDGEKGEVTAPVIEWKGKSPVADQPSFMKWFDDEDAEDCFEMSEVLLEVVWSNPVALYLGEVSMEDEEGGCCGEGCEDGCGGCC